MSRAIILLPKTIKPNSRSRRPGQLSPGAFFYCESKKMPGKTVAAKFLGNWSMLRNNVAAIVENVDV
jgi:hypothetical protein